MTAMINTPLSRTVSTLRPIDMRLVSPDVVMTVIAIVEHYKSPAVVKTFTGTLNAALLAMYNEISPVPLAVDRISHLQPIHYAFLIAGGLAGEDKSVTFYGIPL